MERESLNRSTVAIKKMTRIVLDVHNIWYVGPFIQAASMKLDHSNASELTLSESCQFDFTRNFAGKSWFWIIEMSGLCHVIMTYRP